MFLDEEVKNIHHFNEWIFSTVVHEQLPEKNVLPTMFLS